LPVFTHCKPLCFVQYLCNRANKTATDQTLRHALQPQAGGVRAAAKLP
jgi:hypothetical protein